MNYIKEKPVKDLWRKLLDYCHSDISKLTTEDVLFNLLDCMADHTVSVDDIVKHGKWLISSDGYYPYCSECGEEPKSREITKYCHNCGAKMDKEEI